MKQISNNKFELLYYKLLKKIGITINSNFLVSFLVHLIFFFKNPKQDYEQECEQNFMLHIIFLFININLSEKSQAKMIAKLRYFYSKEL